MTHTPDNIRLTLQSVQSDTVCIGSAVMYGSIITDTNKSVGGVPSVFVQPTRL
jgi:hypothetical protein